MIPALMPKPHRARTKMASRMGEATAGRSGRIERTRRGASTANRPNRQSVPCGSRPIEIACRSHLRLFVLGRDQEEGRERHESPNPQEQDCLASDDEQPCPPSSGRRSAQLATVLRMLVLRPSTRP